MFEKQNGQRHKNPPHRSFILARAAIKPTTNPFNLMNKAQLIEAVQINLGGETSKRAAADALDAVLDAIAKGLKKGPVQLIGFGTFKPVARKARTGRNPKTGAAMKIKASKTVRFVTSAALKKSL
jgi:DNA-binding protein HU-beta